MCGWDPLLPGSPYGPRRRRAKDFEASILLGPKGPKQNFGCQPQTLEGEEGGGGGPGGAYPPLLLRSTAILIHPVHMTQHTVHCRPHAAPPRKRGRSVPGGFRPRRWRRGCLRAGEGLPGPTTARYQCRGVPRPASRGPAGTPPHTRGCLALRLLGCGGTPEHPHEPLEVFVRGIRGLCQDVLGVFCPELAHVVPVGRGRVACHVTCTEQVQALPVG